MLITASKYTQKVKKYYVQGGLKKVLEGFFVFILRSVTSRESKLFMLWTEVLTGKKLVNSRCESYGENNNLVKNGIIDKEKKLRRHTRPNFVCNVGRVRLLGPQGVAACGNSRVIRDSISNFAGRLNVSVRNSYLSNLLLSYNSIHVTVKSVERVKKVDHAISLYSGWKNYYHWIVEHVPKVRYLREYEEKTKSRPKVIIPSEEKSYYLEALKLVGLDIQRCVEWESPAVDVDNFILSTYPGPSLQNLRWLRRTVREKNDLSENEYPNRIYVSRDIAGHRKIVNENEVTKLLKKFEIKKVFTEKMSVYEQVKMFASAEVVVGPHGAGLTNIIWGDNMKVIEIHNNDKRNHYQKISNTINHDYESFEGRSVNPDNINSNIHVNTSRLKNFMEVFV